MGSCTEGGCRPWGGLTLHNGLLITQRADFRVHSGLRGMQKPFFHFRGKLQRLKPRPMKKTPMAPVTDFPWDLQNSTSVLTASSSQLQGQRLGTILRREVPDTTAASAGCRHLQPRWPQLAGEVKRSQGEQNFK